MNVMAVVNIHSHVARCRTCWSDARLHPLAVIAERDRLHYSWKPARCREAGRPWGQRESLILGETA